jgi:hypothetical protein
MEPRHVELVWERYAQRLLSFIRSKVSSDEEAEDILQEVFVRVQRAREKLKGLLLECCHFELDRHGGIIDYQKRCCACSSHTCK